MTQMADAYIRRRAVLRYLELGNARATAAEFPPYSHQTILNWVREAAMPVKPQGRSSFAYKKTLKIFMYFSKGHSIRDTAKYFRITRASAKNAVETMLGLLKEKLDA